ncbi:hypothetical protein BSFA1_84390 (plasmid) [Burkholderia sp. SFA1]|nr:hypothetical protein BSFA1_84390 [Burkholderia sp. SFA1]
MGDRTMFRDELMGGSGPRFSGSHLIHNLARRLGDAIELVEQVHLFNGIRTRCLEPPDVFAF